MAIQHMILELRKFFFSNFGVVVVKLWGGGRGCVAHHATPPPPKNLNMILELGTYSMSNFVVVVGVGSHTLYNPPTTYPKLKHDFWT